MLDVLRSGLELATTHGLTEPACMVRCMVAATLFGLGEWDEALALGLENLEISERNAYFRPTYRTWIALAPILEARRDRDALARFATWFDGVRSAFPEPPSAYGQVHNAAMDRMLATVDLPPVWGRPITLETLATEMYNNFEYTAAVEITIRDWLVDGESDRVGDAVARIEALCREPGGTPPTQAMEASLALMDAWLRRADQPAAATGSARKAAEWARRGEAPWWLVRAIRALPEGGATTEELAEAEEIERRLRIAPGAGDPPV
jgi:hypothetical protein